MIRTYETTTIYCDDPTCSEVVNDTTDTTEVEAREYARRDGWLIDGDRHLCPSCRRDFNAGLLKENCLRPVADAAAKIIG